MPTVTHTGGEARPSRGLFISWTRSNGRTLELARALDLEPVFIYLPGGLGLIGRYARQVRETRRLLRDRAPVHVMLMLPPAPALLALVGHRTRFGSLTADLHTGFFLDPKWRCARGPALRVLRRLGASAVVTNEYLATISGRHGVDSVVLHDIIRERGDGVRASSSAATSVLCPLSYANDEPVDEILEAARLVPALEWILTGEPPEAVRAAAPPNVTFAGFVSDSEYERLIRSVAGVCALTTRAHTMQRAGYEAFNFGVPQVTSDFSELRDFYGESALYTASDAEAIAAAARSLADRREELRRRVLELRPQRIAEQRRALARLTLMLHGSGSRDLAHGKGA